MTDPATARETLDWYAKLPCPSWRELDRLEREVREAEAREAKELAA